jgi:alpha-L-rhamnosidase
MSNVTRILAVGTLTSIAVSAFGRLQVAECRCEYLRNPLGIDAVQPRLSWILTNSKTRGERQSAYRLLVASSPEIIRQDRGDLWDSEKVLSDETTQITYRGRPLKSRDRCYWKVQIWDGKGRLTSWSPTSVWTMGLLSASDWKANWIGLDRSDQKPEDFSTPRYLRRQFNIGKPVRRATVYATALGLYELRINGHRVGDHLLAPEWTNYQKRVQYQTFDVTPLLRSGVNVIGSLLGNGWYSGGWQMWKPKLMPIYGDLPFLRVQTEIEFADGTKQILGSDGHWRATDQGPLRFSGIYEGETIDARMDFSGWDNLGFDDHRWYPAVVGQPKAGEMVAQRSEPIHATQTLKPVSVHEPKPGVYILDLGQNIAGWCRLRIHEPAGTKVTMQFNEVLNPDGTVYMDNLHAGHLSEGDRQIDRYICKGGQWEVFEPHFTYHGFRYVQISGLTKAPTIDSLTGIVFHNGFTRTGEFTCSNPLLNKLEQNIQWSQRANMMGVPTDCCQRDERCGYTGDGQFFMPTAVYNFDVAAFFNKWLVDVCEDSQMPGGWFADHAPTFGPGDGWNVGWSDAGIICPYVVWRTYGDTRVIREHYAAMKRNMALLEATSPTLLHKRRVGNGDWLNLGGGASDEVIGTAYDAYDFRLVSEMAAAIGEKADSYRYAARSRAIASAFAKEYIDRDGHIKDSSQTGFALAFTMGLVPDEFRSKMSDRFVDEINRFKGHLATGFIGTPRLLPGLHLAGRDDVAYKLLQQENYPSWLYPIKLGATTVWERWDGWRPDKGYQDSGMNSFNHYSFGAVGEYLYGEVGGITALSPGYKKIRIQPEIGEGLAYANTSFDSIHGRIVCNWSRKVSAITIQVRIPANTSAIVYIPATSKSSVTESGKSLATADGIKFMRMEGKITVLEVASGNYRFETSR